MNIEKKIVFQKSKYLIKQNKQINNFLNLKKRNIFIYYQ